MKYLIVRDADLNSSNIHESKAKDDPFFAAVAIKLAFFVQKRLALQRLAIKKEHFVALYASLLKYRAL